MKGFKVYMSSLALVGFLVSPAWSTQTALSDSDMDGVYAQGITISNTYNDNDTFNNTTTQKSSNSLKSNQANLASNNAQAAALGSGGDAKGEAETEGNNNANGGDGGTGGAGGPGFGLGLGLGDSGGNTGTGSGTGGNAGGGGGGGTGGLAGNLVPGGNAFGGPGLAGSGAGVLNPNANIDPDIPISANVAATLQTSLGLNVQVIADINAADNGSVAIDDIDDSAVANLSSIANRNNKGNYQAAINGDNVFNNLQNQISLDDSTVFGNESPSINTVIGNVAAPKAVAFGSAYSGPAFAGASNKSDQFNVPVAVSAATNVGLTDAYGRTYADADGGDALQVPIAASANLGKADADADGGASFAADGALGLTGAGSAAFNPSGNAAGLAGATGGVGGNGGDGNDGNALAAALARGGSDNDALSAALAAQGFDQKAKAGDANGGTADAYNDQSNKNSAAAIADTSGKALAASDVKAINEQYAKSDEAKAEGENYAKQENDVNAKSTATNLTAADASGTVAVVTVDQNNLVKSLQVSGSNDNKGNVFLSIQSSVQQQVNNVSTSGYSSPITQGNAVAVNTLFN